MIVEKFITKNIDVSRLLQKRRSSRSYPIVVIAVFTEISKMSFQRGRVNDRENLF